MGRTLRGCTDLPCCFPANPVGATKRIGDTWVSARPYRDRIGVYGILVGRDGRLLCVHQVGEHEEEMQLPGGGVDPGEHPIAALHREAREETGLEVELIELFQVYSDPARDPRKHTVTAVFIARATGTPEAADDAADAGIFKADTLPAPLAFDHADVLAHYFRYRRTGERTALAYPPR